MMKKTGITIINKVAAHIPPTTVVPIERRELAPAPKAKAKGIVPKINAKAVIRIGRKRILAALIPDSRGLSPVRRRSRANSTIRIAF